MENENVQARDTGVRTGETVPYRAKRCTRCDNRFGSVKLDGLCTPCFEELNPGMPKEKFMETLWSIGGRDYPELVKKALLEVYPIGQAKRPKDVRSCDREKVLNIVERRLPHRINTHIERDENPMCDAGWSYAEEPDSYGIEKEGFDIERDYNKK